MIGVYAFLVSYQKSSFICDNWHKSNNNCIKTPELHGHLYHGGPNLQDMFPCLVSWFLIALSDSVHIFHVRIAQVSSRALLPPRHMCRRQGCQFLFSGAHIYAP